MIGRILAFAVVATFGLTAAAHFDGPTVAGKLKAPPKLETSGLAASRRTAGLLWTHDDSGGEAALYGVQSDGKKAAVLRLRGTKNIDWEDVAAFERDGKAWLLVGDVGDNDAERGTVMLHLIEEPSLTEFGLARELSVTPFRTFQVRYEDGPRDCESIAVDVAEKAIYLLSKRERPVRLYRVDLEPLDGNRIRIARYVTALTGIPQPTADQAHIRGYLGKRRGEVCAMDINGDGSAAVVLTYGALLIFSRQSGEPWRQVFSRAPLLLPAHGLIQAEAVCFAPNGKSIFVAAEGDRNLVRYDQRKPKFK